MKEKNIMNFWKQNINNNSILDVYDTNGKNIKLYIIYKGNLSPNFGPDVQNVKIKIDNKNFTGDLEFHQYSLDWFKHNHHKDPKYNNVILHLVNIHNSKIRIINSKRQRLKTLLLPINNIKLRTLNNNNDISLPCFELLERSTNNLLKINDLLIKLGLNNINKKIQLLLLYYTKYIKYFKNDMNINVHIFNQLFFVFVFRALGYNNNKDIFQKTISTINYQTNIEFINYYLQKMEYIHHGRPNNTPEIRIEQFLHFIKNVKVEFNSKIIILFNESKDFDDFCKKIYEIFNVNMKENKIGYQRIKELAYNNILLILYIYFKFTKNNDNQEKVLDFLLNANIFENNKLEKLLKQEIGLNNNLNLKKEIELQGIYYIYKTFCRKKDCEKCVFYKNLV